MPVDKNTLLVNNLNLENVRYRNFYAKVLRQEVDRGRGIDSSYSGMLRYFKNWQEDKIEDVVFSLIDARNEKILPEEDFDWIKEEQRACNFVWCFLKWAIDDQIKSLSRMGPERKLPRSNDAGNFFDHCVTVEDFHSFDKNYQQIVGFFDGWGDHISFKRDMMNSLKGCWEQKKREKIKLEWLKKNNKEQCEWVWEYVKKKFERHPINQVFFVLRPLNVDQFYAYAFAVLDYWGAAPGEKQYFVMKLKKAWDQREYRKKQDGRSPLNTYISRESKKQLDDLAKYKEEKIYQTLERIIRKAHEEFVNHPSR